MNHKIDETPTYAQDKDGMTVQDNWDIRTLKDFFSDHLNVNVDRLDDSIGKLSEDQYEILISKGVDKDEAEMMSNAIGWYVDSLARDIFNNKK